MVELEQERFEFVFKVQPKSKAIWATSYSLIKQTGGAGIEFGTPVYKASGLSTIPQWLRCIAKGFRLSLGYKCTFIII